MQCVRAVVWLSLLSLSGWSGWGRAVNPLTGQWCLETQHVSLWKHSGQAEGGIMCLVFTAVALMGQLKGVYDNHTQPSSQPPTSGFQTAVEQWKMVRVHHMLKCHPPISGFQTCSTLVDQWRLVILMRVSVLPSIPRHVGPTSLQYKVSFGVGIGIIHLLWYGHGLHPSYVLLACGYTVFCRSVV